MASKKKSVKKKVSRKKSAPQNTKESRILVLDNYLHWGMIVLALLVFFTARYHFLEIPLNRDEGAYSYLGKMAIQGGVPYYDFYEIKPPGLFYAYGIFGGIFGFGEVGMRISVALLNLIAAGFIYRLSKNLFGHHILGIITAAFYLLFSLNQGNIGYAAMAEHFVVMLSVISFYYITKEFYNKNLILAGIFIALAMTVKQSALLFFVVEIIYLSIHSLRQKIPWKNILKSFIVFGLPIAGVGILSLALVYTLGDWDSFLYWVFEDATDYSVEYNRQSSWWVYFSFFAERFLKYQWILLLFTATGLLFMLMSVIRRKNKATTFILPLIVFSVLALFPGRRFYSQYWILLVPVISLLAGYAFYWIRLRKISGYITMATLGIVAIFIQFVYEKNYYLVTDANDILESAFNGNGFMEIKKLVDYANQVKSPEDEIMVMGSEPQAYLYFGKDAPTRHVYPSLITDSNDKNRIYQDEAFNKFLTKKPKYVLFSYIPYSWSFQPGDVQDLYSNAYNIVTNNYKPIAYADYVPRNSNFVYGKEAFSYSPRSQKYIVLYEKK